MNAKTVFARLLLLAMGLHLPAAYALCLDPVTYISGYKTPLRTEIREAEAIIIGRVLSEQRLQEDPDDPIGVTASNFTIKVLARLKGSPPGVIVVRNENTSARYSMSAGEEHILFVYRTGHTRSINRCGSSQVMPHGEHVVKQVRRISAGKWFTPRGNGRFSAVAQSLCKESPVEAAREIWSPNHMRKLATRPSPDGDTTVFAIDENGREFAIDTEGWPCPEIGWSPASALFFVTYSTGGAVGTYHVSTYRLSAGSIKRMDLTKAARRDFLRRYPRCFSPEEPNITGVAWSADSTKLLVAAQVLPHSNCDNMGTFKLYAVAVSNAAIVSRIPQIAAKATLRDVLGPELRAADDSCFSQPGSCRIPALHQTRKSK